MVLVADAEVKVFARYTARCSGDPDGLPGGNRFTGNDEYLAQVAIYRLNLAMIQPDIKPQ